MPGEVRRRPRPDIDREGFDRLLAFLDPARQVAGERYEAIRSRLLRFFRCRSAPWPEELCDETIDRVCRKLAQGETIRASDAGRYFLGVARNVLHEAWDREQRRARADRALASDPAATAAPDVDTLAFDCLQRCMQGLAPETRDLLLRYYGADGAEKVPMRRGLAEHLGVGSNALRIRLHRLRARLERCVRECMERGGGGETSVPSRPSTLEGRPR